MKADDQSDEMLPEFDFTRAIRGRWAYLWTPEQREEFLQKAPFDDEANWREYVHRALERLTEALFAYLVLVQGEPPRRAAVLSAALGVGPPADGWRRQVVPPELDERLAALRAGRDWIAPPPADADRRYRMEWVVRMSLIFREAREIRADLEDEVSRHLAGGGLTPGEIERRREETEKLRRAA